MTFIARTIKLAANAGGYNMPDLLQQGAYMLRVGMNLDDTATPGGAVFYIGPSHSPGQDVIELYPGESHMVFVPDNSVIRIERSEARAVRAIVSYL